MLPLKRRFRDSQIVIITNFVVVSSDDIKWAVCIFPLFFRTETSFVTRFSFLHSKALLRSSEGKKTSLRELPTLWLYQFSLTLNMQIFFSHFSQNIGFDLLWQFLGDNLPEIPKSISKKKKKKKKKNTIVSWICLESGKSVNLPGEW